VELPNLMLAIISVANSNQSQYYYYQGAAVYRGAQRNHPVNNSTSMQYHHFHGIKARLGVFLYTNSSALSYNY
jgi:hypothetical protein